MNAINPWLAIPLVLSQLAGIAGFVLGILNYRAAKHQPKLADQRKYRAELREVLFPVRAELKTVDATLRAGRVLADDLPSCFPAAEAKVDQLSTVLEHDARVKAVFLRSDLMSIRHAWGDVRYAQDMMDFKKPSEEDRRLRLDAARTNLRERVTRTSEAVEKCIKSTVEMDNSPKTAGISWPRRK